MMPNNVATVHQAMATSSNDAKCHGHLYPTGSKKQVLNILHDLVSGRRRLSWQLILDILFPTYKSDVKIRVDYLVIKTHGQLHHLVYGALKLTDLVMP